MIARGGSVKATSSRASGFDTLRVAETGALSRASAVLMWLVAVGFGGPAIPCGRYLLRQGRLPTFMGLFPMYGGPAFARVPARTFVALLYAFTVVCVAELVAGLLLWNGQRAGALMSFALLPFEIAFWIAFALPIPPIIAAVRLALTVLAWRAGALAP